MYNKTCTILQEHVLKNIEKAEKDVRTIRKDLTGNAYVKERTRLIKDIIENPDLVGLLFHSACISIVQDDSQAALRKYDCNEWFEKYRDGMIDLRDLYVDIHLVVTKNMDKVKCPRPNVNAHANSMYGN
jgi:hypothetical protein